MSKIQFEKAAPESVGVSSKGIENFLKRLKRNGIDMHSVLIMRDRKLVFEAYYTPYAHNTLHRMFSISKSLTGIAIGMLADDRYIDLDKPICEHFPECEPDGGFHPYIKAVTIRHLLMMTTPHAGTTYDKMSGNGWVRSFFTTTPTHMPGTVFSYDTSASHVLAALVEKITGKKLIDYVRDKGLRISDEAYFITDNENVSQGGSGLLALPYDALIMADMLMNHGISDGERVLSDKFVRNMTSFQVPNHARGSFPVEQQGYGYHVWRTQRNGFMLYGLAGQLAVCFPDKNLILVTTADATDRKGGVQLIFDAFFDEIYDLLDKSSEAVNLDGTAKSLSLAALKNDETYDINKTYVFAENTMGLTSLVITSGDTGGMMRLIFGDEAQDIAFGFGEQMYGGFKKYNCPYAASAGWCGSKNLIIKLNLIGEFVGKIFIQLYFSDNGELTVFMRKTEESRFNEYSGFAQGSEQELI